MAENNQTKKPKSNKIDLENELGLKLSDFDGVTQQFLNEYKLAYDHQNPRKVEDRKRLKLYSNQRRNPKAVGDTTLFTVVQTVLAYMYDDRLVPGFHGREEGDEDQAENLDAMAEFDYDEMAKDQLDYDWWFSTIFYGAGIVSMEEYVRDPDENQFYPLPFNIDHLTFLRDPDASSINGRKHSKKGASRFLGYPVKMSEDEMRDSDFIFTDVKFEDLQHSSQVDTQNLDTEARQARDDARNRQATVLTKKEKSLGKSAKFDLQVWFTHFEYNDEVQKVKLWFSNGGSKLVGAKLVEKDYWPLIYRPLFPMANDFDGVSIPDLIEDKQRARAVITNLGLNALRADVQPMYVFDSNKITNKKDLKFNYNKFLPIDAKGENINTAIAPLQKASFNMELMNYIFTVLDVSAQKSTATPDIQQGIQSQKSRPLGETNLVKVGADTRSSLSSKIGGWSEKEYWRMWYMIYFDNFDADIDEKVLRLQGAFGEKWRTLDKSDFITLINPDIQIESKALNRAQQLEERQSMTAYYGLVLSEPTSNRRYVLKDLGKIYGKKKDELDRIFPPTIDERIAEDQNDRLNDNEFVEVLAEDDHNVHLEIHAKARLTDEAEAHIETHKKALSIKKVNPEFFPEEEIATEFQPTGGTPGTTGAPPVPDLRGVQPSSTAGGLQ